MSKPTRNFGIGVCPICGEEFEKRSGNAVYCAKEECRLIGRDKLVVARGAARASGRHLQDGSLPTTDLPPKRVCHDCGRPTNNYRCAECWARIHGGDSYDQAAEEYSICYGRGGSRS